MAWTTPLCLSRLRSEPGELWLRLCSVWDNKIKISPGPGHGSQGRTQETQWHGVGEHGLDSARWSARGFYLIVQDGLPVVFISHLSDFPGLIAPSSQAHSQPRMKKDSTAGFFSSHCTYRHRPGSCGVTMTSRRWIMARKILGDKTLPFSSTLMCQPPVSC